MLYIHTYSHIHQITHLVYICENPNCENLTGNWSENEARYVFAKIKTATIMRNKIPPKISTYMVLTSRQHSNSAVVHVID